MYCRKCGQQINEDAAFCGNCGAPVGKKNPNVEAERSKKKKGGKRVLGILLLCLLILLGGGAGGWFFLYKSNDDKSKEMVNEEEVVEKTEKTVENDVKDEIQEEKATENGMQETEDTEPVYHEDDEYGIHTYELIIDDVTWTEAYNACLAKGGYLVRINSDEEYQEILEQIVNEDKRNIKFWLGGARDTADVYEYHWIYEDGISGSTILNEDEPFRSYWLDGEPSFYNKSDSQDEMYMNMFYVSKEGRWVWNDVPNDLITVVEYYSGTVGYICEYEN